MFSTRNCRWTALLVVALLSAVASARPADLSISWADSPVYSHRGFMLDSARKFFPVSVIKQILDMSADARLNVFHWHFADNEATSLAWTGNPFCGATTMARTGGSYSLDDVRSIVAYAAARGITVMPEFEFPGHSACWEHCTPHLMAAEAGCGQLDLSKNGSAAAMKSFVRSFDPVFSKAASAAGQPYLVHLGMDEITECWDTWKDGLINNFANDSVSWLTNPDRIVAWADLLLNSKVKLDPSKVALQVWKTDGNINTVVNSGYNVVISTLNTWYLGNANVDKLNSYNFPSTNKVIGAELVWYTSESDTNDVSWMKPLILAAGKRMHNG